MSFIPNLRENHGSNLPTIRIAGIELRHFKSVRQGNVVMNCGKKLIPYGTQSDILGVYGQNGSGKTSLIEAIAIFKYLLLGDPIPGEYADCIDITADHASLTFTLEFQYPEGNEYESNNDVRRLVYSFDLKRAPAKQGDRLHLFVDESLDQFLPTPKERVVVCNESIKVGGTINGKRTPLKPYLEVTDALLPIRPVTKAKEMLGELTDDKRINLGVNLRLAQESSRSFIFMNETLKIFEENSNYSSLYQMLIELNIWGRFYLFVIDSKTEAMVKLNLVLVVHLLPKKRYFEAPLLIPMTQPFSIADDKYDRFINYFNRLSEVLNEIVPGLSLYIQELEKSVASDSTEIHKVELMAKRGDMEIPVRCESDGIKKLIATLHNLITVYNQRSTTVAFDEFDAGIFEYLLGEILQVLQESGKGQFIFTSHNMRPLEVLKKESVCFTTTDPDNRYMKMSGIGETNNLRRVYYREIAMHDHYDNLYSDTKRYKIISAIRRAGDEFGQT